jgi:DNA invertase Pin-like site-specific DNA recombinase
VVELSTLDENKLDRIISHIQSRKKSPQNACVPLAAPPDYSSRRISEQGETVASALKQPQKRLTQNEIDQIILAYQSGKSTNELARIYGCNRHTICDQLKKHSIEIDRSKIKTEEKSKEIIALYKRGLTAAEVAKQTGLSAATIQRHLAEQGIKLRGRWG